MPKDQDRFDVRETQQRQGNEESLDRKLGSSDGNVDNGENQVSNGTQSEAPQPGIARVGNTGAETVTIKE